MKLTSLGRVSVGLVVFFQCASAQITSFPYTEHFDSIADTTLPPGWITTTNRRLTGDFFGTTSSPRSTPRCIYSQNSTISQSLSSPAIDFSQRIPDKLQFYLARSSTHTSGVLVEASVDGGLTFPVALSDTIKNPGSTGYIPVSLQLPALLANQPAARIRWRIVGGSGGSTATLRIDDVSVTTFVSRDLAAVSLTAEPKQPNANDSLVFSGKLRNQGIQPAVDYRVDFYVDVNVGTISESAHRFASVAGPSVGPQDSVTVITGHSSLSAGEYRVFAVV
jgi:hypothetical protein